MKSSIKNIVMWLTIDGVWTGNWICWAVTELLYEWLFTTKQLISLPSPWGSQPEFFFQLNPCGHSPYINILSIERMDLSLMHRLRLCQVYISHITCYWKFFLVHYVQVLCQSMLCKADHVYITCLHSCYLAMGQGITVSFKGIIKRTTWATAYSNTRLCYKIWNIF
jgi:hypothetical protein